MQRIVLVDDEEALAWSLFSRLGRVRPHYRVDTAHDGETALVKLKEAPVDLLVADVRMPGMSGIDLVLTAWNTIPELPVIVMTAFKTSELNRVAGRSSINFLEKPFEFETFLQLVDESLLLRNEVGFSGAISVQTLPDIVQLYVLSNTTGLLTILHRTGEGRLWFEHGAVHHAVTSNASGEDAFFEIMMWSGGEFSMRIGAVPPKRTVTANWQELVMESCRRIDEKQRKVDESRSSQSGWTRAPPAPENFVYEDPFHDFIVDEIKTENHHTLRSTESIPASQASTTPQPVEMTMNVKDALAKLNQIDGFVGAALVDSESGMLLGQEGGGGLNLEVAAAGNTEVVKAKRKTMSNLNLKDTVEDILITLGKQYHIIRPLRSRSTLFFYVALDRSRANLAMARIALADVEKDLQV